MSEPVEILIKRMTAIVRGRESAKGFHFFCQIGDKSWDKGVTTLQISGTGWTLLSRHAINDEGEEIEDMLFSVYLSARDVRALVRILLDHPFWEFDTSRWERKGEETNIHLRVADTGKAFAWGAQYWSSELDRQPRVRALMSTINLIVKTVSEGQITILGL